jgi:hypothetical protein
VIGFQHQNIGRSHAFHDELRRVSEVGQKSDITTVRPQHESHRIVGIVRHRKSLHPNFAHLKRRTGIEQTKIKSGILELRLHRFLREPIAINGNG